ncbi:cell envelope integrity protein TolA [Escherichia coli]
MTSLKTSIKTITYLSDIGCLEIQGASLAIEKQFGDASKYSGKECTLRMHMAPNGLLLEVKRESGDLDLCREAMNAIKNADIPAPPSPEVYKVFQNGVLDFKP